ncbi:MAG: GNAT family N-acetyltransferase, partial [Phycisphaeraceae bacterium]|nr:GNAT family N-acetyltransferase [Phycisphaeraceae bacterium]
QVWRRILDDPDHYLLIGELDRRSVACCTLVIVPNLTRGGRSYGLIENVVTHTDFRGRGIGKAMMRHAQALAWQRGCYKVMLLTGRKDEPTLRFYESAGFLAGVKTGFIAYPPQS